jgi:hypothetical protein
MEGVSSNNPIAAATSPVLTGRLSRVALALERRFALSLAWHYGPWSYRIDPDARRERLGQHLSRRPQA